MGLLFFNHKPPEAMAIERMSENPFCLEVTQRHIFLSYSSPYEMAPAAKLGQQHRNVDKKGVL